MHLGIILDGNRRWAKEQGLMPWQGHEKGAEKLKEILEWCKELKIKEVTLYAFSILNFQRTEEQKKQLFKVFKKEFSEMLKQKNLDKLKEDGVKVRFIGRINMFPEELQETMNKLMDKTKNGDKRTINFAMAYGGREEITDAVKKIAEEVGKGKLKPDEINEEIIGEHLYMNSSPDLIIRTGGKGKKGAMRTSNFLIWQAAQSEWEFLEELLPELTKERFSEIINKFNQRERRLGQ